MRETFRLLLFKKTFKNINAFEKYLELFVNENKFIFSVETLKQRQQKAVDLKEEIDRASQLSESEVAELRLQIKVRCNYPLVFVCNKHI